MTSSAEPGRASGDPRVDAVRRADFWRATPGQAADGWKEWQHFVVCLPRGVILANWSLRADGAGRWLASVVIAVRVEGAAAWRGEVVEADARWRPGGIDMEVGGQRLAFGPAGWTLTLDLPDSGLVGQIEVRPLTVPAATGRLPFAGSPGVRWRVVPRATAEVHLTVGGAPYVLSGAPAYHDHNWGRFGWGDDFVWEWGFFAPSGGAPWSAVFSRVLDRARHRVRMAGLLLWEGPDYARMFRDAEVDYRFEGLRAWAAPATFPPALGALIEGETWVLPERLWVRGVRGAERVELALDVRSAAQVVVLDEARPLGLVVIQELEVAATLSGRLGGRDVAAAGAGLMELVRGR